MADDGETEETEQGSRPAPPPFANILCAIDGSRGSRVAIHQAICLCAPSARLRFAAVSDEDQSEPIAQVGMGEMHARVSLDEAASITRDSEFETTTSLLRGARAAEMLLAESAGHGLLVAGCHSGPRPGGMMLGTTATELAHGANIPLLIARRTGDGSAFPRSMLLATDGSEGSWAAARMAIRLAKSRGSELRLIYVPDGWRKERYREALKQLAVIEKVTDRSSAITESPHHIAARVCEAAKRQQASLIVVARRGRRELKGLGSISKRVFQEAQSSVLAVPASQRGSDPK
jgi:nucleotide-binding universal stress UspA family protein